MRTPQLSLLPAVSAWLPVAGQHILRPRDNNGCSVPDGEASVAIAVGWIGVVHESLVECEFLYSLAGS